MNDPRWTQVDDLVERQLLPDDPALQHALTTSDAAGLPAIAVSAAQGHWLELLARALHANNVLELGTLGGYSTLWLARGLAAGGRVVTLERDAKHADVAAANFAHAQRGDAIELRRGDALEELVRLRSEAREPFDLVFIDADKPRLTEYVQAVLPLSRPGTVIVCDNVVRDGAITDPNSTDASVQGVQRLNAYLASAPRLSVSVIQTVGRKGYDGFAFIVVGA
jgi:predicted O-methyltransferase YrrM